jgi:hypothetical protein
MASGTIGIGPELMFHHIEWGFEINPYKHGIRPSVPFSLVNSPILFLRTYFTISPSLLYQHLTHRLHRKPT